MRFDLNEEQQFPRRHHAAVPGQGATVDGPAPMDAQRQRGRLSPVVAYVRGVGLGRHLRSRVQPGLRLGEWITGRRRRDRQRARRRRPGTVGVARIQRGGGCHRTRRAGGHRHFGRLARRQPDRHVRLRGSHRNGWPRHDRDRRAARRQRFDRVGHEDQRARRRHCRRLRRDLPDRRRSGCWFSSPLPPPA